MQANPIKLRQVLEAKTNLYGPKRGQAAVVRFVSEHLAAERKKHADAWEAQRVDTRNPHDLYGFQIRELAEALAGTSWVNSLSRPQGEPIDYAETDIEVIEAGAGVGVGMFANITNRLLSSKIHEGYASPEFMGDQLTTLIPTRLSGERIATAGSIANDAEVVDENMPYPTMGFGEHFIDSPTTIKRGLIAAVTREAIFFDQTGQVAQRAFQVGEYVGRSREERILDVVIGATNPHSENGTARNTYIDAGFWDNIQGTNSLVDWTDIELAQLLLNAMADPANANRPVASVPDSIICHTARAWTARRIVSATEIRTGDITAGAGVQTVAGNPVPQLRVMASPHLDFRYTAASEANTTWFYGNPRRAFAYMQNWPLTVTSAPANDNAAFENDVVLRVRASERGAATTMEPRHMVESNA